MIIYAKRIQIITICLIVSIFSFTIQIAKEKNKIENQTNTNQNTLETTATPVSGKTIIVDAGHGTPDEGAESSNRNNRSTNKLTNSLKIAKPVRSKW